MCQLIESIKVSHKQLHNIAYHNERFNRSRKELFGIKNTTDLSEIIRLPDNLDNGTYKCRLVYTNIIQGIEFIPYIPRHINSLKLIYNNQIEYSYKFSDRNCFKDLMNGIQEDDILIVKNGFVCDTSFSNIVFFDGTNWITPSTYLLNGTMRRFLLDHNKIISGEIRPEDLRNFESAKLINAMLDIDKSLPIPIKNLR